MWHVASTVGLDVNSPYLYTLWGHHHRRTTLVAECDGELLGFALGYLVPATARDLFIWQIAVDPSNRAKGLASLMLDTLCGSLSPHAIEATVTGSNRPSDALFRSLARRHGATVEVVPCFDADHFPDDHEPEHLYRIDLRSARHGSDRPTSRGENFLGTV
jgi:L-2,4-diaminobutyric acid acetyltransferase